MYLNELDRLVEDTLIPAYTRGERRGENPEYERLKVAIAKARKHKLADEVQRLVRERRAIPSADPLDGDYRRLRYIRYADDFLLGFVGQKNEAEQIRDRLSEFLSQKLKLTLSAEKTLITHAVTEKAKFLGYEITVTKANSLVSENGSRATNGTIALLMPQKVVRDLKQRLKGCDTTRRHGRCASVAAAVLDGGRCRGECPDAGRVL